MAYSRVAALPALRLLLVLALLGVAAPGYAQRQGASIIGTVRDTMGVPIPGVEVGVAGSSLRSRTDGDGQFRILGLLPGEGTLTARRIGYRAYARELRLVAGEERVIDIRLMATAEVLTGIEVVEPRQVYDSRLAGFNARSKQQVGHFVTRDRIDRANSTTLSDMLREVPGVKIGPWRNQGRTIRLRGATCPPLVFVDGFPATAGEFDVDMIDLQSVEGIEIYSGSASIPAEFTGPRDLDRCGVIAIWSRPFRPRARRGPPDTTTVARFVDLSDVYTLDQVDVTARPDSLGMPVPIYPDSLLRARVPGKVVVEFIVDTVGAVEAGSIDILLATNSSFAAAVRAALLQARFIPARLKGNAVRELLQLPFTFAPAPSLPNPSG